MAGRKAKNFDKESFERLCEMQCTNREICEFFRTTDKTLSAWCKRTYGQGFDEIYKELRGAGKVSLRRMQWRAAENNVTMLIWLGKQYLGQTDKQAVSANCDVKEHDASLQAMEDYFERKKREEREKK